MRLLRPEGPGRTGPGGTAGRALHEGPTSSRPDGSTTPTATSRAAIVRTTVVALAAGLAVAGCGGGTNWLTTAPSHDGQTQGAALDEMPGPDPTGPAPTADPAAGTDQPDAETPPTDAAPTTSAPAQVTASVSSRRTGRTAATGSVKPATRSSGKKPAARTGVTTTPRIKAGATATASSRGNGINSGTESAAEAEVVRLVNVQRASAGCAPVTVSPILVSVARSHSVEMSSQTDGVKHNSLDGRTPFQRMLNAGYSYSMAAENIAGGQASAAAVMTAWMNSPGHQANILNCQLTQIGVGMYYRAGSQYGTYWTQDFGTPM